MLITDFFDIKPCIVTRLDETMHAQLQKDIQMDVSCYQNSQTKNMYVLSSHAVTLTFSTKKVRKLFNVDIDKVDPYQFHSMISKYLKLFIQRCIKNISGILYVDFGKKDYRYHLHGYFYCDTATITRFITYCRRHLGYSKVKQIFEFDPWRQYCIKTQSDLSIFLHKAPKSRGL